MSRLRASSMPATLATLGGLALGLALGIALHATGSRVAIEIASRVGTIGTLWTNALRMMVLPIVVTNLLLAIARVGDTRDVGRLAWRSLLVFTLLLAAGAAFALTVTPWALRGYSPGAGALGSLSNVSRDAAAAVAGAKALSLDDWLVGLLPTNVLRAAADDEILPIVLFTALFALALTRVRAERRQPVIALFEGLNDAALALLHWVLIVAPIGVFALGLLLGAHTGSASLGAFAYWVALVSGVILAFTALLYPLTVLLARVPLSRFARAALPAQTVAVATRSSLASLPALIEGSSAHLALPPAVTGLVLPLAVSTFKVNRTLSSVSKVLFLGALYGVHLSAGQLASFVVLVVLVSFSTPGIPSGGTIATIPLYLAAGIPIEGVVMLNALDAIPDIFKTLANVTGDLSAAALVARWSRSGANPAAPARG